MIIKIDEKGTIANQLKNKATYFYVKIHGVSIINDSIQQRISDRMDLVISSLKCSEEIYNFKVNTNLYYLFSTTSRKRRGQLTKLISKHLGDIETTVLLLRKKEFYKTIATIIDRKDSISIERPNENFENYSGDDISVLDDQNNWFSWQKQIYSMLFYDNGIMKKCNQSDTKMSRRIVFLYDETGCTGKSTFWKWLYYHNSENIANLTLGSASQLRSAMSKTPHKNLYICDLPRAIGSQDTSRLTDLIQTLEEVKNGFLTSVMYGEHKTLIMDKPFIIVCSNFIIDANALSKDRWQILEINKGKKLVDITDREKLKAEARARAKSKKPEGVNCEQPYGNQ